MAKSSKKITEETKRIGLILALHIFLEVFLLTFDSMNFDFSDQTVRRVYRLLAVVMSLGLCVLLAAVTYGLTLWAIDSAKMLVYAALVVAIGLTLRSAVFTTKLWGRLR